MKTTRSSVRPAVRLLCSLLLISAPLAAQFDEGPGEVPYVPTPPEVVEAMLKLGGARKGDVVYDLGCGDGRIVIMAAQKFQAQGVGVDINPERIKEAEENARQAGVAGQVRFIEKNLFDVDLRDATLVALYLLPDVNLRLRPKLLKELKSGTRIVSNSFNMDDWKPERTIQAGGRTVYLWTVTDSAKREFGAASVDGEWVFRMPSPHGEVEAVLSLKSDGQHLTGAFQFNENRRQEIQDGTLDGKLIKFMVRRDHQQGGAIVFKVRGTVEGDQIRGRAEAEMDGQTVAHEWTAKRK